MHTEATTSTTRTRVISRALWLEYFTVGWNAVEGVIAVVAAVAAGSVALFGFGIDSFVEGASGSILIWRLLQERNGADEHDVAALDRKAHRLVGLTLVALAAYVSVDALIALFNRETPEPTWIGMGLALVSIVVMYYLARAKRAAARTLDSHALAADAFQTTACIWLSMSTLAGVGINAVFGWWWADPAAALVMTCFIIQEGVRAWRGTSCC